MVVLPRSDGEVGIAAPKLLRDLEVGWTGLLGQVLEGPPASQLQHFGMKSLDVLRNVSQCVDLLGGAKPHLLGAALQKTTVVRQPHRTGLLDLDEASRPVPLLVWSALLELPPEHHHVARLRPKTIRSRASVQGTPPSLATVGFYIGLHSLLTQHDVLRHLALLRTDAENHQVARLFLLQHVTR